MGKVKHSKLKINAFFFFPSNTSLVEELSLENRLAECISVLDSHSASLYLDIDIEEKLYLDTAIEEIISSRNGEQNSSPLITVESSSMMKLKNVYWV